MTGIIRQLDKFYTGMDVVNIVIDYTINLLKRNHLDVSEFSFLEPSAGDGSFLNGIERKLPNNKCLSYDIAPEDPRIIQSDFLNVEVKRNEKMIAIGNPPFGHKGKLAISFINKCSEWCPIIVFVLPIQFRRYNVQKQICDNLKLIYSSDTLAKNSFVFKNKEYDVNCLFQTWVDKTSDYFKSYPDLRLTKPLPNRHEDFKLYIYNNTADTLKYFDKEKYKWDFAVVRQGFYDYSHRITDPSELNDHIQYLFVKYINPCSKAIFDLIDFEKLSYTNTSVLGFSNTDVVAEYVRIKKEAKQWR